jgi:hypothetical protein
VAGVEQRVDAEGVWRVRSAKPNPDQLVGFITEVDFGEAEREFPGITCFYRACARKPRTFLELLAAFIRAQP